MRGITRSVITMAGRNVVTFSSASSPSLADSATKPQLFTSCSRPTRAAESSSTIRTRSATVLGTVSATVVGDSPSVVIVTPRSAMSFLQCVCGEIPAQAEHFNYFLSAQPVAANLHHVNRRPITHETADLCDFGRRTGGFRVRPGRRHRLGERAGGERARWNGRKRDGWSDARSGSRGKDSGG